MGFKKKQFNLFVSLMAVFAISLAACSSGTSSSDTDSTGSDSSSSSDSGATDFSGQSIVASFMESGTYDVAASDDIKPDFESATGASVEIIARPFDQLMQSYLTDLATDTGQYDIISVTSWIGDVYDKLLPLDEYIARDGYGAEAGFIPDLLKPNQGTEYFDGKPIGVPYAIDAYAVLYRKDLFEAAGIDPKWNNWEEMFATLDALKPSLPADVDPFVFAYGATEQTPAIWLSAYDGYLLNSDGTYGLEKEKMITALETTKRAMDYAPSNAAALSIDEANQVFLNGNAAVLMGWPSFVRAAADDPSKSQVVGKWALSSVPGPGMTWLSAWNLGIAKTSENPDLAWEFIKTYVNEQNGTDFMARYGIGSPFLSTFTSDAAVAEKGHDYPQHAKNMANVRNAPWSFSAFLDVYSRGTGDFLSGVKTASETVDDWESQLGGTSPSAGMQEAAKLSGLMQD
jgi:ABC-type glycerol-3-phosphate transport system substrate-binding protein